MEAESKPKAPEAKAAAVSGQPLELAGDRRPLDGAAKGKPTVVPQPGGETQAALGAVALAAVEQRQPAGELGFQAVDALPDLE
jgi:hypothetical protein